jgi:hypothetical protein
MTDRDNIDATGLAGVDTGRREFLKRMAAGAVAAPVVASFSMAALSAEPAYASSNSS